MIEHVEDETEYCCVPQVKYLQQELLQHNALTESLKERLAEMEEIYKMDVRSLALASC
jgi:hypothetical protein